MPVLKQRLAKPTAVIDLVRARPSSGISADGDKITIGAMTTHAEVAQLRRGAGGRSRRWP